MLLLKTGTSDFNIILKFHYEMTFQWKTSLVWCRAADVLLCLHDCGEVVVCVNATCSRGVHVRSRRRVSERFAATMCLQHRFNTKHKSLLDSGVCHPELDQGTSVWWKCTLKTWLHPNMLTAAASHSVSVWWKKSCFQCSCYKSVSFLSDVLVHLSPSEVKLTPNKAIRERYI